MFRGAETGSRGLACLPAGALLTFWFAVFFGLVTAAPQAQADEKVEVEVNLEENVHQIWYRMPADSSSVNCHLLDTTQPDCANLALAKARRAITQSNVRAAAWESLKTSLEIGLDGLKLFGVPNVALAGELILAAAEAESPEELLKETGKIVAKEIADHGSEKLGEYVKETLHTEVLESKIQDFAAGKLAGYLYDAVTKATEKHLLDMSYEDPNCGAITISLWVARAEGGGLEVHMSMAGNCDCKIPAGSPVKLGAWSLYAVAPLEMKSEAHGDKVRLSLSMKGNGEYWVKADCTCKEKEKKPPATYTGGGKEEHRFFATDSFTTSDMICANRCFGPWNRWETAKSDAQHKAQEAEQADADAKKAHQDYEDAKKLYGTGNNGTDPRVEAARKRASDRDILARYAHRQAATAQAAADQAHAAYIDCLKHCIHDACGAGETFGTGERVGAWNRPDWATPIQKDLRELIEKMKKEEGLKCKPFGLGAARRPSYGLVVPGGLPMSYAVSYDSPVWCTYGGGTVQVPVGPVTSGPTGGPVIAGPGPEGGGSSPGTPTKAGGPVTTAGKPQEGGGPVAGAPVTTAGKPQEGGGTVTTPAKPEEGGEPVTTAQPSGTPIRPGEPATTPREPEKKEGQPTTTQAPPPKKPEQPQQTIEVVLVIKAEQSALEGKKVDVYEGALVKVDGPEEDLPVTGKEDQLKDTETGHDADPIQGTTGQDGTLSLPVSYMPNGIAAGNGGDQLKASPVLPASHPANVDLTPQESKIVQIKVDSGRQNATSPATYLVPALIQYVKENYVLNGNIIAILWYPKDQAAVVNQLLSSSNNVLQVVINFCRDKAGPDDPYYKAKGTWKQSYDDQWAIKRIGFTDGKDSAWNEVGDHPQPVTVAVVDTGLDWDHLDISWDNIWTNKKEIPNNGIDDDKNGYVDDVIGWDFIDNDNKPWDHDGHGTFVTGIIAAKQNNGVGIAGINPYAKIMVLRALNSFGHTRASFLARAILYAADNGARVINLSVAGKNLTFLEQEAVNYAWSKGAIVVAAAGNEAVDVKDYGLAGLDHVITVAATDMNDKRAVFSNWGAGVDIAAPGMDVLSLRARRTDLMRDIPGVKYQAGLGYVGDDKRYFRASGTSFAAPMVTGTASLILSRNPKLTNEQVTRMILQSARDIEAPGSDQYTGVGLLDARAALLTDPDFFLVTHISGVKVVKQGGHTFVQVQGTADANDFKRAWIEIGPGETPSEWKKVTDEVTAPVKDGVVGAIPAGELKGSKVWIIRLRGEHKNGKTSEARFKLTLG